MDNWDIFISYSRLDRNIVAPLAQLLRLAGSEVFRDEDSIRPGKKWQISINESLNSCRTLVVFWSEAAADSKSVESEYQTAIKLHKDIVPVLLDDTPLNEVLSQYQYIDLRSFIDSGTQRKFRLLLSSGITAGFIPLIGPISSTAIFYFLIKKMRKGGITPKFTESERLIITELLITRIIR